MYKHDKMVVCLVTTFVLVLGPTDYFPDEYELLMLNPICIIYNNIIYMKNKHLPNCNKRRNEL